MENCSHEFVVIKKGSIWVDTFGKDVLSHTVGSHKEGVVYDLHELSGMAIQGTKEFQLTQVSYSSS